jgi:hypothetical protein
MKTSSILKNGVFWNLKSYRAPSYSGQSRPQWLVSAIQNVWLLVGAVEVQVYVRPKAFYL